MVNWNWFFRDTRSIVLDCHGKAFNPSSILPIAYEDDHNDKQHGGQQNRYQFLQHFPDCGLDYALRHDADQTHTGSADTIGLYFRIVLQLYVIRLPQQAVLS